MADTAIYERSDLSLTLYLVDDAGSPIDVSCTAKILRGDGYYFDGDAWVFEVTSVPMEVVSSGLYSYVVPASKLSPGKYIVLYDTSGNGGNMETVQVLPFKYVAKYGGI